MNLLFRSKSGARIQNIDEETLNVNIVSETIGVRDFKVTHET